MTTQPGQAPDARGFVNAAPAGVATVVLAAVGTGLGILFARQISGPTEHLARVTRLIGRGQYDVRVPFRRTDEIG